MPRLLVSTPHIRGKLPPKLMFSLMIVMNLTMVRSIIVETRDHIISNTGDSVELPCHTDAGHATVYWKRGPSFENSSLVVNVFKGGAYPRRPNVRMDVKNYSMWLDDVQLSDAGHYLCVVAPSPRLGLPKMSGTWLEVIEVTEDLSATMAMHNTSSRESFPMMVNTTMPPNTTRRSPKAPTTTRKEEMSSTTNRTAPNAPTTWKATMTSSTTRTTTNATTRTRKATMTSSTTRTTAKATTTTRKATIVYSTLQTTFEENEREDVVLKNFAIPEKGEAFASTSGGNLIISSISTMCFACFAMFFGLRFL